MDESAIKTFLGKITPPYLKQGPRSNVLSGGGGRAKDERMSQTGVGGGLMGACLKILILIPLNDGKYIYK